MAKKYRVCTRFTRRKGRRVCAKDGWRAFTSKRKADLYRQHRRKGRAGVRRGTYVVKCTSFKNPKSGGKRQWRCRDTVSKKFVSLHFCKKNSPCLTKYTR